MYKELEDIKWEQRVILSSENCESVGTFKLSYTQLKYYTEKLKAPHQGKGLVFRVLLKV